MNINEKVTFFTTFVFGVAAGFILYKIIKPNPSANKHKKMDVSFSSTEN